jgi:TP901 family phage tail tape measure protein
MSNLIGFDKLFDSGSFDKGTQQLAKFLERITDEITKAEIAADDLTKALGAKLRQEISQLSSASKDLNKQMVDMNNKMSQFQSTVSNTKKVISDYERENARLRTELEKLKNAQDNVKKSNEGAGTSFKNVAQSLLGVATGAALIHQGLMTLKNQLILAVQSTLEFEQAMKEVQAITRASSEDLKLLTENANRLGATTEKTAGQVASLQKELGKLGFNTTEILASTDAIVDLSTATGEDLAGSAVVAAATLRAFGLEAIEMGRVVDVMAGSFVRSGLDLEKFRESMKLVAPIARATNINLETTTAALSKLADAGLSGSLAGTALRNLFSSLADPSEKLVKYLGQINEEFADGVGSSEELIRAFKALRDNGVSLADAVQMVDVRARPAFFTIMNQIDAVEGLALEYKVLDGEANKIADMMRDTLTNDLEIASSAFDALRRNLIENFTPALREGTQTLTTFIELFRLMINEAFRAEEAVGDEGLMSSILFGTNNSPNDFAILMKGIMETFRKQVELGRAGEEMEGLALNLDKVGESLTNVEGLTHTFDQLTKIVASKNFKSIGGIFTFASSEAVGLSSEVDILKRKIKEGVITEEEATRALLSMSERSLKSMASSVVQLEDRKVLLEKELKEHIRINGEGEKGTKEWVIQAKLQKQISDLEIFMRGNVNERVKLEQFTKSLKKDTLNLDIKTEDQLKEQAKQLAKQNKELSEKLKLESQITEEQLKREIDTLKSSLGEESYDDILQFPFKVIKDTRISTLEQIVSKELDLAELKYKNELKLLEETASGEANYLLKRQLAYEKFASEVDKILVSFSTAQEKVAKDSTQVTDKAIDKAKDDFKSLMDLLLKQKKERDKIEEEADKTEEQRAEERRQRTIRVAEQTAQELAKVVRFTFDNNQLMREKELAEIDSWEEEQTRIAGDNEDARIRVQQQAESRRKELKRKQALDNRNEAMFQIAIDTAANVVRSILQNGGIPKGIPFGLAAAALGAAQLALVASRPLPAFAKGTDNSPEGFAEVGERGRELVKDGRTGKWGITPDKSTVTYLTKGSQVIPNAQTEMILKNDPNVLADSYLKNKVVQVNTPQIDYNKIGEQFDRSISKIPINITNFDQNGVANFVVKKSVKLRRLNKRY